MTDPETRRRALFPRLDAALAFAARQAEVVLDRYPGVAPMYTAGGKWDTAGEKWTHWCEGFFPGILWMLHRHTGRFRAEAEKLTLALHPRRHDRAVHDLGFLFLSTCGRWHRLTGDPALKDVLVEAGRTLALRRQPGGYLASFIGPHSLFIDIMMNVPIILWAARATDDESLRAVAMEHCRTTAKHLVRPDGGTAHEGTFDGARFVAQTTHQGLRGDSTWARGLAWSLYGFSTAWRMTGDLAFLRTAQANAACWLRRAPAGAVPRWDFDAGDGPFDSSAAAIAASGLWDLGEKDAALSILETLCGPEWLADRTPGWEGILKHGAYHVPKGLATDESVAWGDHFFVEALMKARHGGET
ncbi:MAG: glycoside hydrolase family 88 protein [Gemmataceae bacterium]|nr:glycoside hydrolase family 88 protein [Gemmataceae bacterium]